MIQDHADARGRPGFMERWFGVTDRAVLANARIDFLSALLFGAFGGLVIPFIPVMGRRLGASPLEVSLLVAASAIAMLLSLLWVNVAQTMDPVRLAVRTQVVGRGLLLFMPLVRTPAAYIGLVILYHTIAGASSLGYAQIMRLAYPDAVRGRIMAVVRVGMAVAWIGASLLGGRVMEEVPFQYVFAGAAIFGVAGGLALRRMRVPAGRGERERIGLAGTVRTLRENRRFRRFLAGFFVFGFGAWLMGPAIPLLLVDVLRASNFQVGLLGAVTSTFWVVAYYYWGRFIDRRTATSALVLIFLIGAVTPLIYLVARTPWMVLFSGVTDGFTSAGVDLGWMTAVLQYAPVDRVAHYVAIFNTLVGVRGSSAPFLAGVLIPWIGVRGIFVIATVLTLAGAWIMHRAGSPARPEEV